MARRRIGQDALRFSGAGSDRSSLDRLASLIDWTPIEALLDDVHAAAKGEPAWPPLALFKAMLIAVWYDLSDVKLAEALDDRASFWRFCGFSLDEVTPERTAFVRLRKALIARSLDKALFDAVTRQLKAKAVSVKTGTLVDATIIASAREGDGDARWVKHKGRRAMHGFKAHVGADADTALAGAWPDRENFGTWKRSYGLRRMRWCGLAKAAVQIRLTAIAYNLKRTLNILSQPT
jgi:IS5 family transposase